jgi:hypothetical protein
MTTAQYLKALRQLGLSPHAESTREALGLQKRQLARLAAGVTKPTQTLKLLLEMYLKFGMLK